MDKLRFLGMDFTFLTLKDQNLLEAILQKYPQKLTEYSFASLYAWNNLGRYAWALLGQETLLISFNDPTGQRQLTQPVGLFPDSLKSYLLDEMAKNAYPVKLFAVSDAFMTSNPSFCSHFKDINSRDRANYLYRAEDLATLAGGHYEKKRNLIYQAENLYNWTVEVITQEFIGKYQSELLHIGEKKEGEATFHLHDEHVAIESVFSYFEVLKLKGCVILVEERVVAFSVYGKLNEATADVLFEKAEKEFKGLYQLINRETAKMIVEDGYLLINREEDMGVKGLRQAKESYFPLELVPFHILEKINVV